MPRLFIALHLPQTVKSGLMRLKTTIPTARWSDERQFHLTLRFLGDIANNQVGQIESALSHIALPTFEMSLNGVGCFPENINKPTRVLWAGISAPKTLFDLQKQIEIAMIGAGFGEADKPFNPHITLARLKTAKPLGAVKSFLDANRDYASELFQVTQFALVESRLDPRGAVYTDRRIFELG